MDFITNTTTTTTLHEPTNTTNTTNERYGGTYNTLVRDLWLKQRDGTDTVGPPLLGVAGSHQPCHRGTGPSPFVARIMVGDRLATFGLPFSGVLLV